jgi:hypothetical protein
VYPYDYVNCLQKLDETSLPAKQEFYSRLNDDNVSDDDYAHAQRIWNEFGLQNIRGYHDLYNKSDVLQLADVFENFRDLCIRNYDLDPAWYYTAPGLAWDAALKMTGVKLELLSDPDMVLMFRGVSEEAFQQFRTDMVRLTIRTWGSRMTVLNLPNI